MRRGTSVEKQRLNLFLLLSLYFFWFLSKLSERLNLIIHIKNKNRSNINWFLDGDTEILKNPKQFVYWIEVLLKNHQSQNIVDMYKYILFNILDVFNPKMFIFVQSFKNSNERSFMRCPSKKNI